MPFQRTYLTSVPNSAALIKRQYSSEPKHKIREGIQKFLSCFRTTGETMDVYAMIFRQEFIKHGEQVIVSISAIHQNTKMPLIKLVPSMNDDGFIDIDCCL